MSMKDDGLKFENRSTTILQFALKFYLCLHFFEKHVMKTFYGGMQWNSGGGVMTMSCSHVY